MISDCDSVFNGAKVIDSEFQQQLGEPFSLLGCSFSLIDNMNLEKIVPKFSSTRSGAKVCLCFGWNFIFQRSYRSRRGVPIAVADSVVELPSIDPPDRRFELQAGSPNRFNVQPARMCCANVSRGVVVRGLKTTCSLWPCAPCLPLPRWL